MAAPKLLGFSNQIPTTNMKAILEFNLPQDEDKYKLCNRASSYFGALYQIVTTLRTKRKYEDCKTIPIEQIEQLVWDILQENKIDVYE